MQFIIDNFDMRGPVNYCQYLDAERLPLIVRKINKPTTMQVRLVLVGDGTVVPHQGSRVWLTRNDGTTLFAGYVAQHAIYEYLGKTPGGAIARYSLHCASDEWLLDRKALPQRLAYVARTAGEIVK